jgi:hypothetical protein
MQCQYNSILEGQYILVQRQMIEMHSQLLYACVVLELFILRVDRNNPTENLKCIEYIVSIGHFTE